MTGFPDPQDDQLTLLGRRVLLGITGSIAAYKSAFLARELVKRGAEVRSCYDAKRYWIYYATHPCNFGG